MGRRRRTAARKKFRLLWQCQKQERTATLSPGVREASHAGNARATRAAQKWSRKWTVLPRNAGVMMGGGVVNNPKAPFVPKPRFLKHQTRCMYASSHSHIQEHVTPETNMECRDVHNRRTSRQTDQQPHTTTSTRERDRRRSIQSATQTTLPCCARSTTFSAGWVGTCACTLC